MTADASVRFRWIQAIAVAGMILLVVLLFLPAVEQSRESARRTQSKNNLKQIWLALDCYQEVNRRLPAGGTFDSDGRGYHGWMGAIHFYMECMPPDPMFDPGQPWDAPVNAGHYHYRFSALMNPSIPVDSLDGFAVTHYSANSNLFGANSAVKWSDIPDLTQTFIAAELGGDFVPWGCPYNWRPLRTLTDTPRTYGRIENIGGHFAMADGSVRWIGPNVSGEVLTALRGANLTGDTSKVMKIRRPNSFPYPANARTPYRDNNED